MARARNDDFGLFFFLGLENTRDILSMSAGVRSSLGIGMWRNLF